MTGLCTLTSAYKDTGSLTQWRIDVLLPKAERISSICIVLDLSKRLRNQDLKQSAPAGSRALRMHKGAL